MNHARKMVLVPEQTLERLHQRQKVNTAPLTSRLNGLDHEIQDTLKSKELTDEEKVRMYVENLQNYLTYYDKRKDQPVNVKLEPTSKLPQKEKEVQIPQEELQQKVIEDTIERDLLRALPKAHRSRGKLLIDKIRENPGIMKWDKLGQLIYEDVPLTGSHISDLVGDFLRARKGFDPLGWETFAKGLAKMNTPDDLVRNETRRTAMRGFKARPHQVEVQEIHDHWVPPTPPSTVRKPTGPIRSASRNRDKLIRQRWLNYTP